MSLFRRRAVSQLCALITAAFLPAACTGFPRGWAAAKRQPHGDPVSGAWVGTWRSESSGHRGGLRCVASPANGAGMAHFRFRASWAKILCAGFALDAVVKPDGKGGYTFNGSKNLGKWFGGVFTCTGTLKDNRFSARYEAKLDQGVMEMRRLQLSAPEN